MITKRTTIAIILLCLSNVCVANTAQIIKVWEKNEQLPATFDFIRLALDKASEKYGVYKIETVQVANVEKAIELLTSANALDIVVSGVNKRWELKSLPVYIPLDRGLLGFRLCLTAAQNSRSFTVLQSVKDFIDQSVEIALKQTWPDVKIYESNGFPVDRFEEIKQLVDTVATSNNKCFSRSVIEISKDRQMFDALNVEQKIAFLYPLADIIYVNKHSSTLHEALKYGLEKAIADNSYFELFNEHYSAILLEHNFYLRKLFLMKNPNISEPALDAINKYGIASFNQAKDFDE